MNPGAAKQRALSNDSSREYAVRALEPAEFAQWDQFVRQSPQGTLFHTTLWLKAAGVPFQLLGCFRGSELRGGFALNIVGNRMAGMPHGTLTPYLGVLYSRPEGKYVTELSNNKEIGVAIASFLKSEFKQVNISFPPEVIDLMPFRWQGFTSRIGYTYRLSLRDLNVAFDNMDAVRRRNIISAEKAGVQVDGGASLDQVLRLHEKTFERQRLAPHYSQAVKNIERALSSANRCRAFLARSQDGNPLGGVWIVWDEKRAYYLLGGYDHDAKSNNAVALAMWRAIQFASVDLKLLEFDFEGSIIPPVERFFRKFGGTLTPVYSIQYRKPTTLMKCVGFGRRIAAKFARIRN
jgi:hypothetical protein